MALGSTTNWRDPRFQRQLLHAGSAPDEKQQGLVSRITGNFAGEQLAKDIQFMNIFDQRRAFEADLALRERQLKFDARMSQKRLRDENVGLIITTAAGLGSGVLSHMQGVRRAELDKEERKKEAEFKDEMRSRFASTA